MGRSGLKPKRAAVKAEVLMSCRVDPAKAEGEVEPNIWQAQTRFTAVARSGIQESLEPAAADFYVPFVYDISNVILKSAKVRAGLSDINTRLERAIPTASGRNAAGDCGQQQSRVPRGGQYAPIFKPMCRDFKAHLKSQIELFITTEEVGDLHAIDLYRRIVDARKLRDARWEERSDAPAQVRGRDGLMGMSLNERSGTTSAASGYPGTSSRRGPAFLLALSIIMLKTELHHPAVKERDDKLQSHNAAAALAHRMVKSRLRGSKNGAKPKNHKEAKKAKKAKRGPMSASGADAKSDSGAGSGRRKTSTIRYPKRKVTPEKRTKAKTGSSYSPGAENESDSGAGYRRGESGAKSKEKAKRVPTDVPVAEAEMNDRRPQEELRLGILPTAFIYTTRQEIDNPGPGRRCFNRGEHVRHPCDGATLMKNRASVVSACPRQTETSSNTAEETEEPDLDNMGATERVDYAITKARKEGISAIGDLVVSHFQHLLPTCFRSIDVRQTVTNQTAANNAYVLMPTLPEIMPDRLGPEWFAVEENAKHTYRDADGKGSLKDHVFVKHGTTFPRQTGGLWELMDEFGRGRRKQMG
eukprot:g9081.t2